MMQCAFRKPQSSEEIHLFDSNIWRLRVYSIQTTDWSFYTSNFALILIWTVYFNRFLLTNHCWSCHHSYPYRAFLKAHESIIFSLTCYYDVLHPRSLVYDRDTADIQHHRGPIRTTTFISTSVAAVKASAAKIIPAAIFLRGLKDTQTSR